MTKKKLPFLEWVFILFFAFICLNPKMNVLISMPIFLSLELLYSLYIIIVESKMRGFVAGMVSCSLVIALMYVFTTESIYVGQEAEYRELKSFLAMFFSYLSLCFPILMTYRLLLYGSLFQKKSTLIILIALLSVVFYETWTELSVNKRIVKARMSSVMDEKDNMIVGGYTFICANAVMIPSVFYAFRICTNKKIRWVLLLTTCFLVVFVVRSLYTIALIAAFLGMCYTMSSKTQRRLLPLIILLPIILPLILPLLINILDEGDIKYRIMEIHSLLISGHIGEGNLAARAELYLRGLVSFLSSPIWGNYSLGFDPHSTMIELLASVGLIGFVPFVIILRKSFGLIKKMQPQWRIAPVFATFLFMALTNPVHSSLPLNMTMWLLIPLLYDFVDFINTDKSKPNTSLKFKIQ